MTAQVHEKLIYEGEETSMACEPNIPWGHPGVEPVEEDEIEDDVKHSIVFSTACWRRYWGTWEIDGGRLYLVDIKGVFRKTQEGPIFAEWFTGVLRVPRGDQLEYVHMGYESLYEEDLFIKIENGLVVDTKVVDNRIRWLENME